MTGKRLAGEFAVISGAAGGIGAAACRLFAAEGARVAALDLKEPEDGDLRVSCDLTDDSSVAAAAARVQAEFGAPTIVVHAAALIEHAETLASSPASFLRLYDVNVCGGLRLAQAFAPGMRAARRGSFVFVSSVNASRGTPGLAAYAASKGALETFLRTLALELAPDNIRVNGVSPASIDTPMLRLSFDRAPDPAAARAANILRHPLGRLGTAEDVASMLLFLVSDEASWVTGHVFPVDGGALNTRH